MRTTSWGVQALPAVDVAREARPTQAQIERARVAIYQAMDHPEAPSRVRRYYDPDGNYAGSTFLDLPQEPFTVSATDLFAVSLLDVRPTPRAARRLLSPGPCRTAVHAALSSPALPSDADLETAGPDTWAAAEALYGALRVALGVNPWVTTSKLCARKRPGFFPVRDSVVTQRLLGLGMDFRTDWAVYRALLRDTQLRDRLQRVTAEAGAALDRPITDPPLRVLDVLLWMTAPRDLRPRRR